MRQLRRYGPASDSEAVRAFHRRAEYVIPALSTIGLVWAVIRILCMFL